MYIKTYAARGLLDWQMAINAGGAIIRLRFSGGSMGSNGVIPAKYTTDNPVIQHLIETSEHFKNGRIYLHIQKKVNDRETKDHDKGKQNGKIHG